MQPTEEQIKEEDKPKEQINYEEEQIPQHFYDSDMASVHQEDFMSDNEPPKDITYERKLLYKQKMRHIYKTIIKVGLGIDKPAPYDLIKLRFKSKQGNKSQIKLNRKNKKKQQQKLTQQQLQNLMIQQGLQDVKSLKFLDGIQFQKYNLGTKHSQIETLVISMKANEAALFQVQELEVSQKSNIKILKQKKLYVIDVDRWTTVIDIDGDRRLMKSIIQKGTGSNRVHKFDEVSFRYQLILNQKTIYQKQFKNQRIEQQEINELPNSVWKVLKTMKKLQLSQTTTSLLSFKQIENQKYQEILKKCHLQTQSQNQNIHQSLTIKVYVQDLIQIDDFYMDGSILKKTIIRGVSTAKPQSSSFIYYALKYMDDNRNVLSEDKCFNSDWWQDYAKLEQLGCRKNYLDEYKVSKFLKACLKRMKPAQVSEIECRDLSLFQYGKDYQELKQLWPQDKIFPPKKIFMEVRVYNFIEAKTCFNIQLEQKIQESRRKKKVAIQLLNQGNIKKAYKRFQNIVSFYSSGKINQQAYDEKIAALMNSILCLMKQQKYVEMLPLCEIVLESPKHGFNQDKMKINGPQGVKIEGTVEEDDDPLDNRQAKNLVQNPKIIDKCLYRKALALSKTGESKEALQCLSQISNETDQIKKLREEAQILQEKYEKKSKQMFKQMFS